MSAAAKTRTSLARALDVLSAVVLSGIFIAAIEFVSAVFMHDPAQAMNPRFLAELHGFVGGPETLPTLCRWDAVWYVDIANGSYPGTSGSSVHNGAFFPFFGWLLRPVMAAFHLTAPYAAVWINRACLPVTLLLLRELIRLWGGTEDAGWAAITALLVAPNGFMLVSGYADGFFLFLTLLTVVLAERGLPYWAAVPAFLAGITRVHAFAFFGALAVFGLVGEWPRRPWRWRDLKGFAPAAACGLALALLMAYLKVTAHDPLLFVHEQAYYGKSTLNPLGVIKELPTYWHLFPPANVSDLYGWLRLPVAALIVFAVVFFAVRRRWVESAYAAGLYAMILASSHWGVVRYMVMIYPLFVALSALHRWRSLWLGYLFAAAMLEACLLLQFVTMRVPSS